MVFKDATAMVQAIKQHKISSQELVEQAIYKIEEQNVSVNAVVSKQYNEARQAAKYANESNAPFAGVPILLKDLGQNQKGQLSTSGSQLFKHYHAKQTDYLVQSFEKLGFIILGRTNTPEFGFKNISDGQLHGNVNLPFDHSRNAGGSSGGAAAAVSSGMVPIAGASDGGGSIRIPASFNGLIGLKPSRGRIPVGPSSYRGWQGASSHFALTKSVRDTKRLLYYLQSYQVESPFPLKKLSKESLFEFSVSKPLKIAVLMDSPLKTKVSSEAKAAIKEAADFLSQNMMNSVETAAMFDDIEKSLGRSMEFSDMELMTWAMYQSGQRVLAKDYSKLLDSWDQFAATMARFHENYDLILTAATNQPAPFHGQFDLDETLQKQLRHMGEFSVSEQQDLIWKMFEDSMAWTPFTHQPNLTGQPSLAIPTHLTKEGLPLGVQLTAAKGREDLLLAVAELFEKEKQFKGPVYH
ncbi:TPA: amidase [Streptococcus agalactiae]|uniref:amidase n=1 Tax=Streptococcus agalactiae TaxID=1311 RepID=UPI0004040F49|nr:amidase [Streptococcus agalactiae]HEN9235803.1 amidase [Streptococcus agalactiae]HEO1278420.1 amidase [Streptococcus agalactiae]HEO3719463.1 amidase [Streptococcus agalactiae]HEO4115072.1 amidase [Streptococcus agalactiae]HEO5226712.1 amidase [Streptococcus agalactiae]